MCWYCEDCGERYWCPSNVAEPCGGRETGGLCESCEWKEQEFQEEAERDYKYRKKDASIF